MISMGKRYGSRLNTGNRSEVLPEFLAILTNGCTVQHSCILHFCDLEFFLFPEKIDDDVNVHSFGSISIEEDPSSSTTMEMEEKKRKEKKEKKENKRTREVKEKRKQ